MCANVVGMFLHSAHFGWVRSAGSRGLAAFEEVVVLHGVPSYIEVKGSGINKQLQSVPFDIHSPQDHDLSNAKVVLTCNDYDDVDNSDVDISTLFTLRVDNFSVTCGSYSLYFIDEYRIRHLRFVAGLSVTEVGDVSGNRSDMPDIKAKTVELVGFENVIKVREAMFCNFRHMATGDLSPLSNVTEIGRIFLMECVRLESIDFSPLTSLTSVGNGCMVHCKALTAVNFTGLTKLAKIGVAFMQRCSQITSVDLSPLVGLTDIGSDFLGDCRSLTSVSLPDAKGLTTISRAFCAGCKSLTYMNLLPLRRVTTIDSLFLAKCEKLKSLDLTPLSRVTSVNEMFLDGCISLFLRRTDNLRKAIRIALHGEAHAIHCKDEDTDVAESVSGDEGDFETVSDDDFDFEDDDDEHGDALWDDDNDELDRNGGGGWGDGIAEAFRDRAAALRTPTAEEINAHARRPPRPPPADAPPYLDVTRDPTTTPSSSPTACSVLMCASVMRFFVHSVRFGWVRSAGSRGLAAFEEVVALHGVPTYIEVTQGGNNNNEAVVTTTPPQPVPLWLRTNVHNISGGTVAVKCRNYPPPPPSSDEDYLCEDYYLIWLGETGGAASLEYITDRKISHVRLIADDSVTEVGDDDDIIVELEEAYIYAKTVELVGFTNVTKVMEAMLYRFKHIRTIDLTPLRNVTTIGMLFLSDCHQLKSVDLSPLVNLTRIGRSFLSGNESLIKVKLTGLRNVTTIGSYFIYACESLPSIDLTPLKGVTKVGKHCLGRCPNLEIKSRGSLNKALQDALTTPKSRRSRR